MLPTNEAGLANHWPVFRGMSLCHVIFYNALLPSLTTIVYMFGMKRQWGVYIYDLPKASQYYRLSQDLNP